ncbi:hypothetical protein [Natrinema versiforme]|uniref:Uncharacterized protein n=1 Tax=Natrinema versiforme TaxID=88724 RepID=A0A4P8WJH9_9EURY|nr:hypothetical protein [Natrinema versiforme]QCS43629.1 hypothetical protein FEJ81_15190 [Natrinema versiforme]
MLRRTYLRLLAGVSTLPLVPDRLDPEPRLPADGQLAFWFHFRQSIERGTLSTEWAREHVVEDMTFDRCTRDDAKQALKLAHEGYYGRDVVPVEWREYWDHVERKKQATA